MAIKDPKITIEARYPDRPLDEAPQRWWIAKVKPRQEKCLAEDFMRAGIEYYLPLYKKNTPRPGTGSARIFFVPLFPGYISFSQDKPHDIFRTGRIVNIIEVRNQQRFIRELNQVYRALNAYAPLEPAVGALKEGAPVRILYGPFAGIEGMVSRDPSQSNKLVLSVECLGFAELTIERSWIVPKEEKSPSGIG